MSITKEQIKQLLDDESKRELVESAVRACVEVINDSESEKPSHLQSGCVNVLKIGTELKKALTPKLKPVDMEIFVKSPVDCVFGKEQAFIGRLIDITGDQYWMSGDKALYYNHCQPRLNHVFTIDLFDSFSDMDAFVRRIIDAGFSAEFKFVCGTTYGFSVTGARDGYTMGGCGE